MAKHHEGKKPNPPLIEGYYWAVVVEDGKDCVMPIAIDKHEAELPPVFVIGSSAPISWYSIKEWKPLHIPDFSGVQQAWK